MIDIMEDIDNFYKENNTETSHGEETKKIGCISLNEKNPEHLEKTNHFPPVEISGESLLSQQAVSDLIKNHNISALLTGDRPSGPLHLGHYVGSLKNRLILQHCVALWMMIADGQALTDQDPTKVRHHVTEVLRDYLSLGLDPEKTTFFVQSTVTPLYKLFFYLMNTVGMGRLRRNPTLKAEIQQKGFGDNLTAGFFCYPVSQCADIGGFSPGEGFIGVPVGHDQLPMIELYNDVVDHCHHTYGTTALKKAYPIMSPQGRLMGIDGKNKASKSLNNAIFLKDDTKTLREKVFSMYTDPLHIRREDPGHVEGNVVFMYLDAFYEDQEHLQELKDHYQKGGLGDVTLKNLLFNTLETFLAPLREKRAQYTEKDLHDILNEGNKKALNHSHGVVESFGQDLGLWTL